MWHGSHITLEVDHEGASEWKMRSSLALNGLCHFQCSRAKASHFHYKAENGGENLFLNVEMETMKWNEHVAGTAECILKTAHRLLDWAQEAWSLWACCICHCLYSIKVCAALLVASFDFGLCVLLCGSPDCIIHLFYHHVNEIEPYLEQWWLRNISLNYSIIPLISEPCLFLAHPLI